MFCVWASDFADSDSKVIGCGEPDVIAVAFGGGVWGRGFGGGREGGAPGRLGFMEKLTGRSSMLESEAAGEGEEGTTLS